MKLMRKYLNRSKKIIFIKVMVSIILSIVALLFFQYFSDSKLKLFILMFLMNYVMIDGISAFLFTLYPVSVHNNLSEYLFKLQDEYPSKSYPKKNILLLVMKDVLLEKSIDLRFLKSNFYEIKTEHSNMEFYTARSITRLKELCSPDEKLESYLENVLNNEFLPSIDKILLEDSMWERKESFEAVFKATCKKLMEY